MKKSLGKSRKNDMDKCGATIYVGLKVVEALSVFMAPFMPFASKKLRGIMNIEPIKNGDWFAESQLKAGHKILVPEVLFPKFDDKLIEEQIAKLPSLS